jgi:hypothetical protein
VLTTRSTHAPSFTLVPAAGLWLITWLAGTLGLACSVTDPTASLAFASVLGAAACVCPTTFGTTAACALGSQNAIARNTGQRYRVAM